MSGKEFLDRLASGEPYTDKTGSEYHHPFAPEVEPLARVMYSEMRRLDPEIEKAWEELSDWDREFYMFALERILVERELLDALLKRERG